MKRHLWGTAVCLILMMGGLTEAVDEIAFEAEDADTLMAPMGIVEDEAVSGGKYIKSTQGRQGWAEYEIEIPEDATYYMWGRVQEHDGVSDSFFITFDADDRGDDNDTNENTWDLDGPANAWAWDPVSGRGAGGDPREFELDQGTHRLRVWTREPEAWLDCIFVSTERNAFPTLASEFEGRPRKALPRATRLGSKLALTWGQLKK